MNRHFAQVLVEQAPSPMKLEVLNVEYWPVIKEPAGISERHYAETETSFIVAGAGEIAVEGQATVKFTAGDLVTVLPETQCLWHVTAAIERHYCKG